MTKLSSRDQMPKVFRIVEMAVERGEWEAAHRWLEVFVRARPRCSPEWRQDGLTDGVDKLMQALNGANQVEIQKRIAVLPGEYPSQTHHTV